jgi:hypothetical protein
MEEFVSFEHIITFGCPDEASVHSWLKKKKYAGSVVRITRALASKKLIKVFFKETTWIK